MMDYSRGVVEDHDYLLLETRHFDLSTILDCGQCFRWEKIAEDTYEGVVRGLRRKVSQLGGTVRFHGVDEEEFQAIWFDYFDFGREYGAIKELLCKHAPLRKAVEFCPGMRVLRQEPWEALCSFILSQNNHIPRIKGLVDRLCVLLGEKIPGGGYAFPPPEALAGKNPEDLAPVRCGFRAKYLIDAANRVVSGEVPLYRLKALSVEESGSLLMKISGVGPKVAACALLYGCGRAECVPVDVWMGRALAEWFPQGLPEEAAPVAGLAQQYLFHYIRNRKE